MAQTKLNRNKKKQLGQFMTPIKKCQELLESYNFTSNDKILEPSFGEGNFILSLIDKFLDLYEGSLSEKVQKILINNIYGVELDEDLFNKALYRIEEKYGFFPTNHNFYISDFLVKDFDIQFDYIIGNPPFGGSINPKFDEVLEKKYGKRFNEKIKKETYSFFIVKSIEHLKENGILLFISSDTFLTIKTMKGLRNYLFKTGSNKLKSIDFFSEETNYPMVVLTYTKSDIKDFIIFNDCEITSESILLTDNFSWYIPVEFIKYFKGDKLSKYVTGSGGMTVGKNEYFLRDIANNTIQENYEFTFFQDPITLEKELSKARLNKIGEKKTNEIIEKEKRGESLRNVRIELTSTKTIQLPNSDYKFYNKASNEILYAVPKTAIFWKDNGDACLTYKKCGNWYLGGVGGKNFFEKECITWQLISSKINARYLEEGYILDNSSPIIVLKDNIDKNELYFILAWLLTNTCTLILKNVINHTKNIQSKDIERLPYPFWIDNSIKSIIVDFIKESIIYKKENSKIPDNFTNKINELFEMKKP
jgi:hypothetical protein